MSGHSKWHSIKHKKGAADAKRGKIFTRHAKLIEVAARGGPDPAMNAGLRLAIENAKAENVPNANIDRAIKKGSGQLKDGAQIEEVLYEGYGPSGVAMMINCLTDNTNRTFTNIRTIMSKNGGNIGEKGSVAYMFDRKGILELALEGQNAEEIELAAIDAGAEDIEQFEGVMRITTAATDYVSVKDQLEKQGVQITKAVIEQVPQNTIKIEDESTASKILKLVDLLEEDDDVDTVASNFDIDDSVLEKLG